MWSPTATPCSRSPSASTSRSTSCAPRTTSPPRPRSSRASRSACRPTTARRPSRPPTSRRGRHDKADAAPAKRAKGRKGKRRRPTAAERRPRDRRRHGGRHREAKGESYKARKGDTLAKIADRLDTDVAELKRAEPRQGQRGPRRPGLPRRRASPSTSTPPRRATRWPASPSGSASASRACAPRTSCRKRVLSVRRARRSSCRTAIATASRSAGAATQRPDRGYRARALSDGAYAAAAAALPAVRPADPPIAVDRRRADAAPPTPAPTDAQIPSWPRAASSGR